MLRRTFFRIAAATAALQVLRGKLSFAKAAGATEPLLAPWTGKYGGVPPFDKIKLSDWKPAFTRAMELHRDERTGAERVRTSGQLLITSRRFRRVLAPDARR